MDVSILAFRSRPPDLLAVRTTQRFLLWGKRKDTILRSATSFLCRPGGLAAQRARVTAVCMERAFSVAPASGHGTPTPVIQAGVVPAWAIRHSSTGIASQPEVAGGSNAIYVIWTYITQHMTGHPELLG